MPMIRLASWLYPRILILPLVAASTLSATAQQHAHTHGLLTLDVAIDSQSITIQIESPLDSFVGFERAPRTDAERRRVADMVAKLNAAERLFLPDPAAGCKLSKVELVSETLGLGPGASAATAPAPRPGAKAPPAEAEHADIDIAVTFSCVKAGEARYIDIKLFDQFTGVRTINAQVASGQGQFKRTLRKATSRLAWGK